MRPQSRKVRDSIETVKLTTKGGDSDMIIVPLKDGENIERAIKRFKRKFEKTGAIRELRARKNFVKPSVKRREQLQKAIYVQHMQLEDEQ